MTDKKFKQRCEQISLRVIQLINDVEELSIEKQAGIRDFNDILNSLYDARDLLDNQYLDKPIIAE